MTNARHTQILRTQEPGSIKLIEKTRRTVSRLRTTDKIPHIVVENLVSELSQEIIRLRRGLINERTHRTRLAASLLPRLRSKCVEVRTLRQKLYGKPTRVKSPKKGRISKEVATDMARLQMSSLNGTH